MKKILFALLAVAFVVSLCFAQEPDESSTSDSQSASSVYQPVYQVETKSFTGKVNSISVGNLDEGTKTQITVTDHKGQNVNLIIDSDTLVTDKDGNMLEPANINNASEVAVIYTVDADGINKAQSVKATE